MKHETLSRIHSFIHELNDAYKLFAPKGSIWERLVNIPPIVKSYLRYHISPKEYFQFRFSTKSENEKERFLGKWEHNFMVYFFNNKETIAFYQDKWKTYSKLHSFFNREIVLLSNNDYEEFAAFASRHNQFIAKPVNGSFGDDIFLIKSNDANKQKFNELNNVYGGGNFIVEEYIEQNHGIAELHPQSVNTIRIYTLRYDDEVIVFHPWLRIGRGGSIVDNASAGGLGAALNFDTGRIIAAGDKRGHSFTKHPDNGIVLNGFQIPLWDEVKTFTRNMALVDPDLHFAGWDVAITQNGCSLVEVNPRAQIGFQIFEDCGLRCDLDNYLTRFNLFEEYYKKKPCWKIVS